MNDIDTCDDKTQYIPDPEDFGLPRDFIFIEQQWGSMFYKHIGKKTRGEAKQFCSSYGDFVHLPIPRFREENEFYRKYFADETLWLDISRTADGNFSSSYGQLFLRLVKTALALEYIKNYGWMNISNYDSEFVILTENGEWETADESLTRDAVCVFNILPHEDCSKCQDEAFCRFANEERTKTECVCPVGKEGEFCQDDSCYHCQNQGYCKFNNGKSNVFDCVCPKPFFGENCTSSEFLFILLLNQFLDQNSNSRIEIFQNMTV